jgi:hypothetical protein
VERRFLTFLVLSFGIMAVWQILNPPPQKPVDRKAPANGQAVADKPAAAAPAGERPAEAEAAADAAEGGDDQAEVDLPEEYVNARIDRRGERLPDGGDPYQSRRCRAADRTFEPALSRPA